MRPKPRSAAITGIGLSRIGRHIDIDCQALAAQAASRAITDAGLSRDDIDGLVCWPGRQSDSTGASPVGVWDLKDLLGLSLNWYAGGAEGPAQMSSIMNAVLAVSSGHARHVLCFRATTESISRPAGTWTRTDDYRQWLFPFNSLSLTNWAALAAQQHFHQFGMTREHLAAVAINARKNAALNPDAIYREPLTLDAYLSARIISTPLCLYDCDVPVVGAVAMIVSAADAVSETKMPPVWIEAISGALTARPLWDHWNPGEWAGVDAARRLWTLTDLKPKDVDFGAIYDGFSVLVPMWLEALGFCGLGEGGAFVEDGKRISRDGELPLNTSGGQLSAGRLHGLGLLHEAVVQLRGEAGARQLPKPVKVAVVSNGAGPLASCALLVRE